jgi:iron complex outermembrane receptor protein
VIALSSDYRGTDLRWTNRGRVMEQPYTILAGLAYDTLEQRRQGYLNFVGTTLGVQGALRRDELDTASDFDPYAQATLQLSSRWSVSAGVRRSHVRFDSADRYDQLHLYATAGRGFETPTLNEIAYSPIGSTASGIGTTQQPCSTSFRVGS